MAGMIILAAAILLVGLVILEGKRQEKKYGRPSGRPNLMGVGMLDLQKHLQADRKTDTLQQQQKDEIAEVETDESGDDS